MIMTPTLRKLALTAHITSSVGWLGAVASFLILAIVGLISKDHQTMRAAYLMMDLTAWFILVPLALASLVTGLVQSLGTSWGLFRHYWVLVKFLLTMFATVVLLLKTQLISFLATIAANTNLSNIELAPLRTPELVIHAAGGLLVLLFITVLSVYKPWGLSAYGRRKAAERRKTPPDLDTSSLGDSRLLPDRSAVIKTPRWVYVVGIHTVGLVLLFLILHLKGGGVPGH